MAWTDGTRRISREELLTWTRASNLPEYRSAGWSERIVDWLKNGALEGVATDCQWSNGPQNLSTGPVVLAASWWANVDSGHPSHYAMLWKSSDIHLYVPDPTSGAITKVHFKGVRLEPIALALALDETVPLPAPAIAEPETFDHWLTPAEALEHLPSSWGVETKQKAIAIGLEDGLLRAAAATVVAKSDGKRLTWAVFKPIAWRGWDYFADDDFWTRGTFAGLTSDSSGYGRYEASKVRAHDVRLDPDGIAAMLPRHATPRPAPLGHDRAAKPSTVGKDVTADEVREWHNSLSPERQADGVRGLKLAARAAFAPRRVYDKHVNELVAGRPRGRPRVNG